MVTPHSKLAISSDVATQALPQELILLHLVDGVYYSLEDVGMRFWQLVEERGGDLSAVYEDMCAEFEASPEEIWSDLEALVEELASRHLVIVTTNDAA